MTDVDSYANKFRSNSLENILKNEDNDISLSVHRPESVRIKEIQQQQQQHKIINIDKYARNLENFDFEKKKKIILFFILNIIDAKILEC